MDELHIDVCVIGAGMSGVGMAYYLNRNCKGKTFTILEARDSIGGTWDLFQYPGIRSDSDMYTFGFAFNPWLGNKAISEGGEIVKYLHSTTNTFDLKKHIRLGHSVSQAHWDTSSTTWTLEVQRPGKNGSREPMRVRCCHVVFCTGYYDYESGFSPAFPNSSAFKGDIIHPQHWPVSYDPSGKRIVVIGSGATAVTLIPNLAAKAAHVTMLQRSPTYIAAMPAEDTAANYLLSIMPKQFAFNLIRWFYIARQQFLYRLARIIPEAVKQDVLKGIKHYLGDSYDMKHFSPDYAPWDQRFCVCPDGDFFKCIKVGQASVVTDHIDKFTARGVLLQSGLELPADTIVTATGLNLKVLGGVELYVDGQLRNIADGTMYKGVMFSNIPNMAWTVGYVNASFTLKSDLASRYICRMINYMDKNDYKMCLPTPRGNVVSEGSVLGLTSGYIERGRHLLPKQGTRAPWIYYQSYFKDVWSLCVKPVAGDEIVFK